MPTSRRAPANHPVDLYHCLAGVPAATPYQANFPVRYVTSSRFGWSYGFTVVPSGYITTTDPGLTGPTYANGTRTVLVDFSTADQVALTAGGGVTHFVLLIEGFFPFTPAQYSRVWLAPLPLPI